MAKRDENIRTSDGKQDINDNQKLDNQSNKEKPEKGSKWT